MPTPPDPKSRLKEKLRQLPHKPGVYLFKDRFGSTLYVGKAKDLKKRVSSYFQRGRRPSLAQPKITAMIPLVFDVDTVVVRSETESLLLEGKLIKHWKPKYNTTFTDDKRFLLIRLDLNETFPRFRLIRFRREDGARYFGPFASGSFLRRTLAEMRKKFGILLGDAAPPTPSPTVPGQFLLYNDARAEIYGHTNEISAADYATRLANATAFLEGKTRDWLASLKEQMLTAAAEKKYERAAHLRDLLEALSQTRTNTSRDRRFTRTTPQPTRSAPDAPRLLAEALGLPVPPRTLECFDISHISGEFTVAAMVRFVDAQPDKAGYRHFHLRGDIGNDDYRAMEQVVARRYMRLQRENKPFPDLLVIDGGKGQVHAALKAFLGYDLPPPPMIGLAKKAETIIFPGDRADVSLPLHSPALQLLQRLRDEAHRFANTFNAKLRSKKIRESLLDEFSGLGPTRKAALLEKFKDLTRLRAAAVDELAGVSGIGPTLAARLFDFLKTHR